MTAHNSRPTRCATFVRESASPRGFVEVLTWAPANVVVPVTSTVPEGGFGAGGFEEKGAYDVGLKCSVQSVWQKPGQISEQEMRWRTSSSVATPGTTASWRPDSASSLEAAPRHTAGLAPLWPRPAAAVCTRDRDNSWRPPPDGALRPGAGWGPAARLGPLGLMH